MLERLRRVLVESFVGVIGLGYLLAETVLYFVNIFSAPLGQWAMRRLYPGLAAEREIANRFPFEAAVPQAVACLILLLIWCALFYWLYFPSLKARNSASPSTDLSA